MPCCWGTYYCISIEISLRLHPPPSFPKDETNKGRWKKKENKASRYECAQQVLIVDFGPSQRGEDPKPNPLGCTQDST